MARSYDHLSCNYLNIGKNDIADSLVRNSLSYIHKCNEEGKGYIYGNYANYLMGEKKYSEAKQYLNKAIQAHPFPNHYIMLGKISKHEGDTLQARLHWEKAMTFDNQRFTIKAYKLLGEMYAEQQNYPLAFEMLEKADSVKDAWHEQMRTAQLTEIQHRYGAAITEKALTERKNLWLTTYLVMQQMGLDDKRICELLNITDSTVRNYRHRLRNPK